jgi:Fic family protein
MKDLLHFLEQSNAIEGVYDLDSLQQSYYAWEYIIAEKELSRRVILAMHRILMYHQDILRKYQGHFRKVGVRIGNREGLSWIHIPEAMEIWSMNAWLYPEHWQEHHVRFEEIHPFVDGNGRSGRILMNWQRIKAGLPLLVIEEAEKVNYYDWFKDLK